LSVCGRGRVVSLAGGWGGVRGAGVLGWMLRAGGSVRRENALPGVVAAHGGRPFARASALAGCAACAVPAYRCGLLRVPLPHGHRAQRELPPPWSAAGLGVWLSALRLAGKPAGGCGACVRR